MAGYRVNLEAVTLKNKFYRKVLFTTKGMQLVVMSIPVGGNLDWETHATVTQFIRVESGRAVVVVGCKKYHLKDGDGVIIPQGSLHYVENTGKDELKLYTIYTPPEHTAGLIQRSKN